MPACRAGQTRDTALPSWLWFDAPGLFALNVRRAACGLTARPCRRATRKRPLSPHHDLGSILAQKAQQNPCEKSLQGQPITRQVFRRTACKGCPTLSRSVVTQGPSAVTPALYSRTTFSLDALLYGSSTGIPVLLLKQEYSPGDGPHALRQAPRRR
jgi:hypothetical protein